jgi:flagellar motor switch protein FliM
MRKLSLESIRDSGERLPDDLSEVAQGFQRFSKAMTKESLQLTNQKLTFSYVGFEKAVIRPIISDNGSYPGISKMLRDSEAGKVLRVTVSRELMCILCESAFGGNGFTRISEENRPPSNIERELAHAFVKIIGQNISTAFDGSNRSTS